MLIKIENNAIYVSDNHDFDGTWNQSRRMWKLPNTLGALEEINRVRPSEEIASLINKRRMSRLRLLNLKKLRDTEGEPQLRPYQRVDVAYLRKIPHVGIFSEMRTGKTPVSIQLLEKGLNIVIAPASILLKWEEEILQWSKDFTTTVISGTKAKRTKLYAESFEREKEVIIVSYETLRNDVGTVLDLLKGRRFATVLADEAHRMCNHRSGISKASYTISTRSNKRVAITGTPVRNKPQDIYGILTFLYPDVYTSYWQWLERYFHVDRSAGYVEVGGYKREKELTSIIELFSVSRKRKDVMPWLPDKEYVTIKLEMKDDQRRVYRSVLDTFTYEEDGETKVDASGVLPQLTRLRQITLSPELLDIKASSAKEAYILEWLSDNSNEQVIIFSSFSSYLRILLGKLKKESVDIIDGSVTKAKRNQIVRRFQAGKLRILLANIQAGGVGLTLDNAETVIFMDKDYTPILNDQAEDRIIPVAEDRNHSCTIITLVVKDSVDEKVEALLKRKQNVIATINDLGMKNILDFVRYTV